jgi:hypothetical protein
LTLISAPAGFGKTTLLSEWVAGCEASARFAWLSLPLSFAPVGVFMLTGAIVFRIKRMRKETNDESSDWKHLSRVKYLYPVFDQERGFLDPL